MSGMSVKIPDYEPISQFSITIGNQIGRLNDLVQLFHHHDEHIVAISVTEHTEVSVVRIIPSYPEEVKDLLKAHSINFIIARLIGVELDSVAGFTKIVQTVAETEANINYIYPLFIQNNGHSVIAISVDNLQMVSTALRRIGLPVIGQRDIAR
jgi:hypothetical protein